MVYCWDGEIGCGVRVMTLSGWKKRVCMCCSLHIPLQVSVAVGSCKASSELPCSVKVHRKRR